MKAQSEGQVESTTRKAHHDDSNIFGVASLDLIERIVRKKLSSKQRDNATSVILALNDYGAGVGLDPVHRLAQYSMPWARGASRYRWPIPRIMWT